MGFQVQVLPLELAGARACPACRREIEASQPPCAYSSAGTVSICIGCGSYLLFCGDVFLLDAEAFAGLPVETRIAMRRLRDAIRATPAQKGSSRS